MSTMLKIRLQRIGRRNNPSYRVVVVDSRSAAKKGKPVELLGTHDAIRKTTVLDDERVKHWISQGAQVSDTMHNILIKNGVIEGVKVNVLPKKSPVAKEEQSGDAEAATDSAAPDAADAEKKDDAADEAPSDGGGTADAPKAEAAETPAAEEKSDAPEAKDADAEKTEEEKPQASPPQDTPSAEG